MSVWNTTSVEDTPELHLASWRVFEIYSEHYGERTRHFVGYNLTEREGRVSSKIMSFDPTTGRGITNSGRVYQLMGSSGHNGDGMYVWGVWANNINAQNIEDVTEQIIKEMTNAIQN